MRTYDGNTQTFDDWGQVSMYSFYKDYSSLAALATAAMEIANIKFGTLSSGDSKTFNQASGFLIVGDRYYGCGIYAVSYNSFARMGGRDNDGLISRDGYNLTISGPCLYFLFNTYN